MRCCEVVGFDRNGWLGSVGIRTQTTLSRWLHAAGKVSPMSKTKKSGARRPQDWPAAEKMAVVMEASTLSEEDLGAFLRQRGLHAA